MQSCGRRRQPPASTTADGSRTALIPFRLARVAAAAGGVVALALFCAVAFESTLSVGRAFPSFLILANRVVPSISLPHWGDVSLLFQAQVIAVDQHPVSSAAEIDALVRRKPAGTRFTYLLHTAAGDTITAGVESRLFSWKDYALGVAAPLATGLLYLAIGLSVLWLRPERAATYAFVSVSVWTGLVALTGAEIDGARGLLRLHVLAEAMVAPAYIHLALVFPADRMGRRRGLRLAALYLPFAALGVWAATGSEDAAVYVSGHLVATSFQGAAIVCLLVSMATQLVGRSSALARRRVGVVAIGILAGLAFPAALAGASAAVGGKVPINGAALLAVLFPLSLAYAIVARDLFDIDRVLVRAISYAVVAAGVTAAYLGLLGAAAVLFPTVVPARSPATHAVLGLVFIFVAAPTRDWVRRGVDRLFVRKHYDPAQALGALGPALACARSEAEVARAARAGIEATLGAPADVLFLTADGRFVPAGAARARPTLPAPELLERLAGGEVLARYEWDDRGGQPPPPWDDAAAEIVVPLRRGSVLLGLLVAGPKRSGFAYNTHDLAMLQALATPLVMALTAASAVSDLERLNASLEEQVGARTAALERTNAELQDSLQRLRDAYLRLEHNQAGLVRADRLATLGRLSAGLAHEINTPLGAVMNSLKIVIDLAEEYAEAAGDPTVLAEDHREIAAEILESARVADGWARKAAAFLGRTKAHGRDAGGGPHQRFEIAGVVDEVGHLLGHRLRIAGCQLEFSESSPGLTVLGEPGRLSQVLVNLVANAIDAYEDAKVAHGRVSIIAERRGEAIEIRVRDWAGGIPAEVLPRIFDELFTTKDPERGTGLGLWIVRSLVEDSFGGRLTVSSVPGRGSCFAIVLPAAGGESAAAA